MSWGSKTTQQQQSNGYSNNTTIPIQQDWAKALQGSVMAPAVQSMIQQAGMPVFGSAQVTNYMQGLNDQTNAGQQHLASTLAGRGILNSGAFATGASQLEQNRQSQGANFFAQLPFQEREAEQQNMGRALSIGTSLAASAPVGQQSTTTSSNNSSGTSTTTQDPGLGGLVSSLMGVGLSAALGGFGGGGGLFGGGGHGQGSNMGYNGSWFNPVNYGPAYTPPSQPWAGTS